MPETRAGILSQWHAHPLSRQEAERLKAAADACLQVASGKRTRRLAQITLMRARYWLEDFGAYDFELLARRLTGPRRLRAMLFLTYGQLLLARKQKSAFGYLDQGLRLADGLLKPRAYFEVYNRHEALRQLRLSANGTAALSLSNLLHEAGVIEKLTRSSSVEMVFQASRFDTLINKPQN